jgi:hypothetical protein
MFPELLEDYHSFWSASPRTTDLADYAIKSAIGTQTGQPVRFLVCCA